MGRRKRKGIASGFEEWGGYMAMKKLKLQEQFSEDASKDVQEKSNLFHGISIFVNGYTDPSADELRNLMMHHGGVYHHYYRPGNTTYVIATNLPDSKLKMAQGIKFLKPSWVTDCIKENKVLDFRPYLLYTNKSKSQPGIKYFSDETKEATKRSISKTASDKDFLTEFYMNSRLHHISTMGAHFKQYINDLRSNGAHIFTGRDELMKKSNSEADALNECIVGNVESKVIMHIDMDCFFVSVGIRDCPELKGIPVAVTHAKGNRSHPQEGLKKELELYKKKSGKGLSDSESTHWTNTLGELDSMSEVASCSYEARAAGVKNGMFLGQAMKLCPNLKPIPYDFEVYKEVSYTLYNTVARYTLDIEAVSCDEMYVDCTKLLSATKISPLAFAAVLRNEIKEKTRCPCSVGFGRNKLQARIATKKAKPDGHFFLESNVEEFFKNISVSDLPGVGYSTSYKLKSLGVKKCGDLQSISLQKLQSDFGMKNGETLYKYCRGIDDKQLVFHQVRKSVSAEVNYGIRFQNDSERDIFIEQLSKEVSDRVKSIKMKGRSISLKLMVRSKDAPEETAKFLGHGVCDHITKSSLLPTAVSDAEVIFREVILIINKLKVDSKDLRGIGIQLTRLESEKDKPKSGLIDFFRLNQNKSLGQSTAKGSARDADTTTHKGLIESMVSSINSSLKKPIEDTVNLSVSVTCQPSFLPPCDATSLYGEGFLAIDQDGEKSFISPGDLKDLLNEWIGKEGNPAEKDVSFVNKYFQELVMNGHLDTLSIMLKYFHRFIEQRNKREFWKSTYITILQEVQLKMINVYKGELALDNHYLSFE